MKIIRTVWGDPEYVRAETEKKFIFGNEIVYVWGTTNADYLKSIGYEVILVSPDSYNPAYNRMTTKYYHKLLIILISFIPVMISNSFHLSPTSQCSANL